METYYYGIDQGPAIVDCCQDSQDGILYSFVLLATLEPNIKYEIPQLVSVA